VIAGPRIAGARKFGLELDVLLDPGDEAGKADLALLDTH
jgi:hypothetical protein